MSYFMALLLKYRGKAFFICNTEQEIAGYCIASLNYRYQGVVNSISFTGNTSLNELNFYFKN
jgi:hypothetical protein